MGDFPVKYGYEPLTRIGDFSIQMVIPLRIGKEDEVEEKKEVKKPVEVPKKARLCTVEQKRNIK